PLVINSDRIIWERMDINRGINDLLETGTLPPHIWLDSGKINLWVLLDRLGLEPHLRRIPLRHAPALIRERYWVFRFLVSESDLIMGREIFAVSDPVSRALLAQRWNHWPGTLLAGCIREHLPGPVQQLARIDDQGLFTLTPFPDPA
ncbi:MAG: hypothetical protein OEW39_11090, partial [Deltaproteobacteria bacterium]|nr:hypothetical protein [Deltaproteobacteria bacterium]